MPVQVEACAGAHEVAGKHEPHQQLLADGERIELLRGDRHQRARRPHDERAHAGQPRGDGIGERVAIERHGCGFGVDRSRGAEVDEGQHDDGVLLRRCCVPGLAKALGQHGEQAGGALLLLGRFDLQAPLRGHLRDGVAGHADRVELQRLHHRAQALAHIGGGGEAGRRLLFQAAQNHRFELDRQIGDDLAQVGRIGELDGANGLKLRRVGPVKGVASAGELVEDQPKGEYVGLDGRPAGDELLRRHVSDGASTRGVGGLRLGRHAPAGTGGIEVGLVEGELARQAEVEDLDQAAVGEHDVGRLQVAMKDAEQVRGGETVGNLDAGGENQLQAGRTFGNHLVQRFARDVLHDDIGFVFAAGLGWRFAHVVDGADVGMVDRRGQSRLAELRGTDLLQRQRAALEQLEDDGPLQQRIRGQIHDAAAARANFADELVVPDCAALHTLIIARLGPWKVNV